MTRWQKVKRWWALRQPPPPQPGELSHAAEYHIVDGVDYRLPYLLPGHVRAQGMEAIHAHLTEAASQYNFQFDAPRSGLDNMLSLPDEDPLAEWDPATRRRVLENCHAAFHRNPLAKRAVNLTRQFTVGKGHTVTCLNQDVQKVIDDFRADKENAIANYDRTLIEDLQVDGEIFIRFFVEEARVKIAPIPPWHIRYIRTEKGFFRRIINYNLFYTWMNPDDPSVQESVDENVPAADILHVAINNHSYELRGRSDLYVILPWLKAYKDWIEDRARQNKWRGTLLWWVKIAGAAPGSIAAKVAQWKKPPTSGSAYVSSDREEVQPLTNAVAANDASEDGRQIRMMNVIGVGLAEYMLGDGENANLASATAQQLPALWKFTDAQELMAEQVWRPIYQRVIQAAVDAGLLPALVEKQDSDGEAQLKDDQPEMIPTQEAVEVIYYDLQAPEPKTLAEALSLLLGGDLISVEGARQVAAPSVGLDATLEAKRVAAQDEAAPPITPADINTNPDGTPMTMPDTSADEEMPQEPVARAA